MRVAVLGGDEPAGGDVPLGFGELRVEFAGLGTPRDLRACRVDEAYVDVAVRLDLVQDLPGSPGVPGGCGEVRLRELAVGMRDEQFVDDRDRRIAAVGVRGDAEYGRRRGRIAGFDRGFGLPYIDVADVPQAPERLRVSGIDRDDVTVVGAGVCVLGTQQAPVFERLAGPAQQCGDDGGFGRRSVRGFRRYRGRRWRAIDDRSRVGLRLEEPRACGDYRDYCDGRGPDNGPPVRRDAGRSR